MRTFITCLLYEKATFVQITENLANRNMFHYSLNSGAKCQLLRKL